jgi:NAD(P)H-hydrate epimerase
MTMFLKREEARELDRRAAEEFGVPGLVLMENAGRGMAELLLALGVGGPVVVCCGPGNNGGDGFVIARHLDIAAVPVRVLFFGAPERLPGDAAVNFGILNKSGVPLKVYPEGPDDGTLRAELDGAEWVVDALFGSGLKGPLRPPFDRVVAGINAGRGRVLAVDIPSGLDCDTGRPMGPTVRAHHTATVVAPKKGFAEPAAREWLGQVHVVSMGAPRRLLEGLSTS